MWQSSQQEAVIVDFGGDVLCQSLERLAQSRYQFCVFGVGAFGVHLHLSALRCLVALEVEADVIEGSVGVVPPPRASSDDRVNERW